MIVLLMGFAGTGIGSKIERTAKLGDKQLRKRHRRYTTVRITNEYHTSQTCSHCLSPIIHPKMTKIVKRKHKMLSNQGTSLCLNIHYPIYKSRRNSRNRDVQAAECIALAEAHLLLTGKNLP
jgi:hypothetical protein